MYKVILFSTLAFSLNVAAQSADDAKQEAMVIKDEKCLTNKCFSNVADPNFPDSNTPQIVNGVFGEDQEHHGDSNAVKDI